VVGNERLPMSFRPALQLFEKLGQQQQVEQLAELASVVASSSMAASGTTASFVGTSVVGLVERTSSSLAGHSLAFAWASALDIGHTSEEPSAVAFGLALFGTLAASTFVVGASSTGVGQAVPKHLALFLIFSSPQTVDLRRSQSCHCRQWRQAHGFLFSSRGVCFAYLKLGILCC